MNDLRYALRSLRNHSGFTAAAVLTLGLGIGGTSTMFGVLDDLFLSPPAGVSEPDDVVRLYIVRRAGSIQAPSGGGGSYPDLEAMRAGGRNLAGLAAFDYPGSFDYGRGERAARIRGQAVTADFFSVLGIRPALGRLLVPDDGASGTVPVAVLGHGFWQREFGGDSEVVGHAIELDGRASATMAPFTLGCSARKGSSWA
ncbi:MAG: ABC transporter permease [Gemmatimonadetes bacterium]|nr:ABC transporter permease [Gemmatimonadota bacterium]